MSADRVVDARGVCKVFRRRGGPEVRAVNAVNLTVGRGEVVALVGRSGSGKTTLARCILGLEPLSAGEVWLEGARFDDLREADRRRLRGRYQYVPQDALSALDPQQTVLEHVVETLTILGGVSRQEGRRAAVALLARLGLEHRRDALPRELSGGEQRRVTLARVFALQPRLVVADEPTSGLDPDRQESVLRDLVGNLPEGAGCLLVTHDLPQARAWCHRAVVMLEGEVVEELPLPDGVPSHPYARTLFDPWGEHDATR
ncbi:MAG: dipeptide/oligopeptide/nickel ABC transporter ATP-binding protein [Myxococcales bacterium]|nr:dipeptide/oligopeptide/nickel ABC transporter ATP-binding protein [Myxococcales bacterium]